LLLSAVTMRLRGAYLALATLAFGLLVDSLTVALTDVTGGPSGLALLWQIFIQAACSHRSIFGSAGIAAAAVER
jgi:ABC-type branched-subunit amino acid transport system permease subunit